MATKGTFNQNIILKVAKALYESKHHDEKHDWSHIKRVRRDLKAYIKDHPELREDEINVLFTALVFHDCNMKNKKKHHEKSADSFYKLVQKRAFRNIKGNFCGDDRDYTQTFLELNIDFIYQCIFEHRSSINAKHKTDLGRITSLIDFGYPFPLHLAMRKAIKKGLEKVENDYAECCMAWSKKDNFDYILHEGFKWFEKRWLNKDLPRDITKEAQDKLIKTFSKKTLAHALVDMLYK